MAKEYPRHRPIRSVTLNPALVQQLIDLGQADNETRLSVLLDAAMREYIQRRRRGSRERRAILKDASTETGEELDEARQ